MLCKKTFDRLFSILFMLKNNKTKNTKKNEGMFHLINEYILGLVCCVMFLNMNDIVFFFFLAQFWENFLQSQFGGVWDICDVAAG